MKIPIKPKSTWIRALGVPLQLWLQRDFTEIGNLCGGWVETEETGLKNHWKWATIKICGDEKNCQREVLIERDGINFFNPIWVETKVQFQILMPVVDENHQLVMAELGYSKEPGRLPLLLDHQVIELASTEKRKEFFKRSDGMQMRHPELPEIAGVFLNETPHSSAKEGETQIYLRQFWGQGNSNKKLGPDKANVILNDLSGPSEAQSFLIL